MKTKHIIYSNPMKNIFLLLLLITGMVQAQIVSIPDANFKNALVNTLCVDTNNDGSYEADADINNDGEIEVSEALLVENLNVSNLSISDLTGIQSFTNLVGLYCYQNQLSSLNVSGLVYLKMLWCQYNQLTSLDLTGITNLWILHCEFNQLTTLDLSGVINYPVFADCSDNNLTSLFIKNNRNVILDNSGIYCQCSGNMYFFNNPNLAYVCCDEGEISSIQAYSGTANYSNFVAGSYCSFSPGGNFNSISGTIRFDANNDGCDATDFTQPDIRVNINDGTNTGANFSTNAGNYLFYTQAGSFDITPSVENPSWFTFSPVTATIPFTDNNNNTVTQDFCIAANGVHPDLEIVIAPLTPARPGFDAVYKLVCRNKGTVALSSWTGLTLSYDSSKMSFVASTLTPSANSAGFLDFGYSLNPFESASVDVTFHINSPLDVNPVDIGTVLTFNIGINPTLTDETPADNTLIYNQTVVGSFDPNDITCLEGDVVPSTEIGKYLHYAINFENTGTFPAENVVVKTAIDAAKFDIGSLQLMNSNFPVDARITDNKVEFIFKNIQLGIGGHGHILLKIKTQNTLVTGDAVANRGDIYFDYNAPIDTGLANTVFETLSNSVFELDQSIALYPNPASNELTVQADNNMKSIELYDAQGRIILTRLEAELVSKLDITSYSNGIYFVKITTEKGAQVQKIIKE